MTTVTPEVLKNSIRCGKVQVVNLKLTSDGRLIDIKEPKKIESNSIDALFKEFKHNIDVANNAYTTKNCFLVDKTGLVNKEVSEAIEELASYAKKD